MAFNRGQAASAYPGGRPASSASCASIIAAPGYRGLHSSTVQLNLSHFLHTIHPKHPSISITPLKHPLNNL